METPTLTPNQQKRSLSGKKKTQKSLRNVLSVPYKIYWPLIDQDEEPQLCSILESALRPARQPPSPVIPLAELKTIPREQRRKMRKALVQPDPASKELRQQLLLGVNALTRALEKDDVACALLAQDVDPPILTRHITSLCALHKVPLLAMRKMRSVTRDALGFSCIAMGLKKSVTDASDNHFHPLHQKIKELSDSFPHTEPMSLFHNGPLVDSDDSDHDSDKETKPSSPSTSSDVYRYRTSRKERAFIPSATLPLSVKDTSDTSILPLETDFLKLGATSDDKMDSEASTTNGLISHKGISVKGGIRNHHFPESRKRKHSSQSIVNHYKEPVIKRIRSNPNKVKKKNKIKKNKKP